MTMREKMGRAIFAVGAMKMSSRKTWDTCEQTYRDLCLAEADAALDCLTAPPTEAMIEAAKDTPVSHCWGSKGEFITDPESIWEVMVRTMIEEGK